MIDFLIVLFGSSGMTLVFILASIFSKVRDLLSFSDFTEELIYCPMCLGFWVGLISGFIFEYNPIYFGFLVSLISWTLFNVNSLLLTRQNFLESKIGDINE